MLADERCAEATLLQLPCKGKEDGGESQNAHFFRADKARKDNPEDELNRLHGDFLYHAPFDTTQDFFFYAAHVGVNYTFLSARVYHDYDELSIILQIVTCQCVQVCDRIITESSI